MHRCCCTCCASVLHLLRISAALAAHQSRPRWPPAPARGNLVSADTHRGTAAWARWKRVKFSVRRVTWLPLACCSSPLSLLHLFCPHNLPLLMLNRVLQFSFYHIHVSKNKKSWETGHPDANYLTTEPPKKRPFLSCLQHPRRIPKTSTHGH